MLEDSGLLNRDHEIGGSKKPHGVEGDPGPGLAGVTAEGEPLPLGCVSRGLMLQGNVGSLQISRICLITIREVWTHERELM